MDNEEDEENENFIVSDDHLSNDEKNESDIEFEQDCQVFKENINKLNLFDILDLKKNYTKPYIINMSNAMNDPRISKITSMVTGLIVRNKENRILFYNFN